MYAAGSNVAVHRATDKVKPDSKSFSASDISEDQSPMPHLLWGSLPEQVKFIPWLAGSPLSTHSTENNTKVVATAGHRTVSRTASECWVTHDLTKFSQCRVS